MIKRVLLLLAAVAMLVLVFAPAAQAQTFNERIPLITQKQEVGS
jgi:hypothetical protein